ncbi:MAG: hypothetical protein AAGD25_28300 [Cyanobacteria bacterium P01_F01_bin.150]
MSTNIFDFLGRYFWAVGLLLAAVNTALKWLQLQPRMRESPELAPGYMQLLRGFWLISTLPWIPMGIGILWGNVPTIWYFLYPSSGNPYVLAWWGVYWCWVSALAYWVLFRGGAKILVTHPGFLRGNPKNPKWIKVGMLLALVGAAIASVLIFNQSEPIIPDIPDSL